MQIEKLMTSGKMYTLHSLGNFEKNQPILISIGIKNPELTNVYILINADNTITMPKGQSYSCQA